VLVSHLHGDHFAGLPFFLLDAQLVSRRTAPLLLAGRPGCHDRPIPLMEAMFAGSTQVQRTFRDADLFICEAYFFDKVMKYHIDCTTLLNHLPRIGARRTIVTHVSAELLGRGSEIALEAADDGLVVEF
jgi:ribonuclease BN (tRNA processing enzyme)